MIEINDQHLGADKNQNGGQAELEQMEALGHAGQHEIQCTQAQHRKDIRAHDDIGIRGHGKDRGDRVQREHDIRHPDQGHDQEQRRKGAHPILDEIQRTAVILMADR